MNAQVELALLALLRRAFPEEFEHFADAFGPEADAEVSELAVTGALSTMVEHADTDDCADRFALVQALVLGVRMNVADGDALENVADRVLGATGADRSRKTQLVAASGRLLDGVRVTDSADQTGFFAVESVLRDLEFAFEPWLDADLSVAGVNHLRFTGKAAATAAMITESTALYETMCSPAWKIDPTSQLEASSVQIELCTSLPFDECRRRIDPCKWPECNPYFNYVKRLDTNPGSAQDWYGRIQEDVGPGLNYSYYRTDLKVRYLEQPGLAATAFDIVPPAQQTGDGRVTIDRGFLAVIDEGAHRRVQMVKVYRIEDQTGKQAIPHEWVCPLWAQQMTLAGWSCGATVPMRKALKVWSEVMRDMVAITRCACGALHCDCDDTGSDSVDKATLPSKAASALATPLSPEQYDVPLPSACHASFTPLPGQTAIAVAPGKKLAASIAPLQVIKAEFGQAYCPPHAATIARAVDGDALLVTLGKRETGLFLGRLHDPGAGVDVPFTLYDNGL